MNEENFRVVGPPSIAAHPEAHRLFLRFMDDAKRVYAMLQHLGIHNEDARSVLPNAVESEIVISANFRELRHIFCPRRDKQSQWEIKNVALDMLRILKTEAPAVFGDFVIDEKNAAAHTRYPS